MAYIIAVCGAGGKTSYIRKRAEEYAAAGKKTVVSTTTHIGCPTSFLREKPVYDVIGKLVMDRDGSREIKKLSFPGEEAYQRMCREYDIVLLEADGSRHFPIKIPASYEPVIPYNTDEIVIVMGLQAVGRRFGTVCHRAELLLDQEKNRKGSRTADRIADRTDDQSDDQAGNWNDRRGENAATITNVTADTIVTKELIRKLAETFYLKPLSARFPDKKITLYLNEVENWTRDDAQNTPGKRKTALILLASGFARRFGSNKLLRDLDGRPLYRHVLMQIEEAALRLRERGVKTEIIVCTAYPEIERELQREHEALHVFHNPDAAEGISASIRLGAEQAAALGCTDAVFFVADMPFLPSEDIARYIEQYLYSGKTCAVMCASEPGEKKQFFSNPGILSLRHLPELRGLSGEQGGMRVIGNYPEETYFYQIEAEKLRDVDTPEDLAVL